MREVSFIKQNKANWLEFENYLYHGKHVAPKRLEELFTQLNNDLAYTQSYYPKSKINTYLNALTSQAYLKLIKPRSAYGSVIHFWKVEVPRVAYVHRRYIYLAFCIFSFLVFIGVLSSLYDETFVRSVLGDKYVDSTMVNIERQDPAAVYTNATAMGDIGSFLGITINNIRVGFLMYITGITLGIGTLKVMLSNCIMLGSFLTMFYKANVLWESMRAIWIHGAMEIFGMVIEAAAGLLLGLGWLFPGSLSRKAAFILKGKESLMLMLSTLPFTIAAGLLEGFVTQLYNEMPVWLALVIILGTLSVIGYYYLIYPIRMYGNQVKTFDEMLLQYEE